MSTTTHALSALRHFLQEAGLPPLEEGNEINSLAQLLLAFRLHSHERIMSEPMKLPWFGEAVYRSQQLFDERFPHPSGPHIPPMYVEQQELGKGPRRTAGVGLSSDR